MCLERRKSAPSVYNMRSGFVSENIRRAADRGHRSLPGVRDWAAVSPSVISALSAAGRGVCARIVRQGGSGRTAKRLPALARPPSCRLLARGSCSNNFNPFQIPTGKKFYVPAVLVRRESADNLHRRGRRRRRRVFEIDPLESEPAPDRLYARRYVSRVDVTFAFEYFHQTAKGPNRPGLSRF